MKDAYYFDPRVAAAYDAEHAERDITTDDIPFYVDLALEAGTRRQGVLELACGTGRVTIPIAEAGVRVTGLDQSPAMLDVARAKAAGHDNPRWVQADMTSYRLDERYGLVIIPFNSFLHLLTVAAQKECLRLAREHLLPGGRLALNVFNPEVALAATRPGATRVSPDAGFLAADGRAREPTDNRRYPASGQRPDETRTDDMLSDAGAVISRIYRNFRLRYVFHYEMERLLAQTGFQREALHGWFDRRPFRDDSRQMIWVARRREDIT